MIDHAKALEYAQEHLGRLDKEGGYLNLKTLCQAYLDLHQRMQWQPIESAPKDHKGSFLIYDSFLGEVREATFKYEIDGVFYFGDPVYNEWECHTATHWQPLPESPKTT